MIFGYTASNLVWALILGGGIGGYVGYVIGRTSSE